MESSDYQMGETLTGMSLLKCEIFYQLKLSLNFISGLLYLFY